MKRKEKFPAITKGLVQHIVDNFDAEMSSPNEKVSTHALAMIKCYPEKPETTETDCFTCISKYGMQNPVHFDQDEDEKLTLCHQHFFQLVSLKNSMASKGCLMNGLKTWILNF